MNLEELLARVNVSVALREFTFNKNRFSAEIGQNPEFADGVLWLKSWLVVFQVKERRATSDHDRDAMEQWFHKKVKGDATRQIRKTHGYLQEHKNIPITNLRGHRFNINTGDFEAIVNVVLFGSAAGLPAGWPSQRYYLSRSTGRDLFIHFIKIDDYIMLCGTLLTPMEVIEYLQFREQYLLNVDYGSRRTEKWLLGRFLMSPDIENDSLNQPAVDCSRAVDNLDADTDFLKVRRFLEEMGDRIVYHLRLGPGPTEQPDEDSTDYYQILIAFALLNRTYLKAFNDRLKQAIRIARQDQIDFSRFEERQLGYGYVIIGLPRELHSKRRGFLMTHVKLNMYERKLAACAGVSVCFGPSDVDIDWTFFEEPWKPNEELDKVLREHGSPFRPLKEDIVNRYKTEI